MRAHALAHDQLQRHWFAATWTVVFIAGSLPRPSATTFVCLRLDSLDILDLGWLLRPKKVLFHSCLTSCSKFMKFIDSLIF